MFTVYMYIYRIKLCAVRRIINWACPDHSGWCLSSAVERFLQVQSGEERKAIYVCQRKSWPTPRGQDVACTLNEATRSSDLHSTMGPMGPPPQLPILPEKDWTPKHEYLHQKFHDNHFNNSIIIILTFRSKPPCGDAKGKVRQSPKSTDLSSRDPIRTGDCSKFCANKSRRSWDIS